MNLAVIPVENGARTKNTNSMITGSKRAGVSPEQLGDQKLAIVEFVNNKMSDAGKLVSDKEFYYILRTLAGKPLTNSEARVAQLVFNAPVVCSSGSEIPVYAGAALAYANLCIKAENSPFHTMKYDEVLDEICNCMCNLGVECTPHNVDTGLVIKQSPVKGTMSGYAETLQNLGYSPGENATVDNIAKRHPTSEAIAKITSLGIKPQPVKRAMILAIANGLKGTWPVDVPYYPYSVNFAGDTGTAKDPSWENVGMSAATKLFDTMVDVGGSYLKSEIKIAQDQAESDMKVKAAKDLGIAASSVTSTQLNAWASANPNEAANIAATALKNSGVSQQQIDEAKKKLEDSERTKKYLMYGGAAVGGAALIGLLVFALRRK